MLTIPDHLFEQITAHCRAEFPLEACGVLVGTKATGVVDAVVLAENLARSETKYVVDPVIYLRTEIASEVRGATILGVFHSHPSSDPQPSATDIELAPDPDWHYLILGLAQPQIAVRCWRINGAMVTEEPVQRA